MHGAGGVKLPRQLQIPSQIEIRSLDENLQPLYKHNKFTPKNLQATGNSLIMLFHREYMH